MSSLFYISSFCHLHGYDPYSVMAWTFANAIRKSQFILQVNIIGSRCNCAFKRYNDGRGYADGTVSGCRIVRRGWINVDAAVAHGPRWS